LSLLVVFFFPYERRFFNHLFESIYCDMPARINCAAQGVKRPSGVSANTSTVADSVEQTFGKNPSRTRFITFLAKYYARGLAHIVSGRRTCSKSSANPQLGDYFQILHPSKQSVLLDSSLRERGQNMKLRRRLSIFVFGYYS